MSDDHNVHYEFYYDKYNFLYQFYVGADDIDNIVSNNDHDPAHNNASYHFDIDQLSDNIIDNYLPWWFRGDRGDGMLEHPSCSERIPGSVGPGPVGELGMGRTDSDPLGDTGPAMEPVLPAKSPFIRLFRRLGEFVRKGK